uniref:Bicarbonate transporter-like transmembrane domain-containing protein n=1 Tax=Pseudictyota dubia TaxID=2749911 RepID=A0A7R9VY74_9STRA|mmetsp:Transcript_25346/g.47140  ORF Transcript_25346/g.47140 Transcript_25346/m.47140 type:complete len:680 (+) Transcript_25346:145-2184(+)|eukprot:CAMPEP_0197446804 /NCGR_PEP_ID=MMETSP1175-20131217/11658_1 /TAXON_ID=1003142 /ORGANISM="Triceratium dubium, Strain CCMP147" /LENGTH=679 /DNA_ID=CAMNT_0042977967 /DNA_START=143 /DNA_END=2182 /DNA_ORIENTATION=-
MCKHGPGSPQSQKDEESSSRPNSPTADDSSGSYNSGEDEKLISFMTGIKSDLAARKPYYVDDWKVQNYFTVINATVYAFVIQLIPALIFAELMDRNTEGNLATAEVLMSSGIMGIIYAIFAGQPLTIMGITGPVAVLLGTSYGLTEQFDAEYFPFFFWTCLWAGLMHCISAVVGLVSLVWSVTPFTTQIFEFFIAITFLYASLRDLIEPLALGDGDARADRGAQYATMLLGLLTFGISWSLHFAETWAFFTRHIRTFLTSYNTAIAVVAVTAISFIPGIDQANNGAGGLDRVNIRFAPWDWQPTADRPWVVNPVYGIGADGIFAAMIPGFMFFLLFIIDHNVSSILTQSPKYNLKKPAAYHWDFFIVGLTFLPCAILGLPPGNGLIPQAPLHARALCTRKFETDRHGVTREVVTHCEEQRWSGLGQSLLMFVALSAFTVLSWIPRGCLFGLLLYLGMGALHGNEIWERITFCFILPKKRPAVPVVRKVKWRTVQLFTFVQVVCAGTIFAIAQFASFGYIYPALLAILVPLRSFVLTRFFNAEDLKHLDPTDETEEEYHEEQRLIRETEHNAAAEVDVVALEQPHFQEFHPGDLKKRMVHKRRHTIEKGHNIVADSMHLDKYLDEKTQEDPMVGRLAAVASSGSLHALNPSSGANDNEEKRESFKNGLNESFNNENMYDA